MKKRFHYESNRRRCHGACKRYDRWFSKLMNGAHLGRIIRRKGHSKQHKRSAFTHAIWRHNMIKSLPF